MNLKKYSYYTSVLLLCCGCNKCGCNTHDYVSQEEEGYHTKNLCELGELESFETTITILATPDAIIDFRKKLSDRSLKWLTSGTEKEPYRLWKNFFTNEIQVNIVDKLSKLHDTTLLKDYYDRFGNLFKEPTEANGKEVIKAVQKLQANRTLMQAFKECITARRKHPESIYLTKPTLEYQEFLYFILERNSMLHSKLQKVQLDLKTWKKDKHTTGQALWINIIGKYYKLLNDSKPYKYTKNQDAIKKSLKIIDQLADDPYGLSYVDLLEILPHGINKLREILYEIGVNEKDDIQSLKTYLETVEVLL